jgi:hypothetical protein
MNYKPIIIAFYILAFSIIVVFESFFSISFLFNNINFIIGGGIILILMLIFKIHLLRKKLPNGYKTKIINKDLRDIMFLPLFFLLIMIYEFIFEGLNTSFNIIYSSIILYVAFYGVFVKFYIKMTKPDMFSIVGNQLIYKGFFKVNENKIEELKDITYHVNQKWLSLNFTDALDTIKIYFKDYNPNELEKLLFEIVKIAKKDKEFESKLKAFLQKMNYLI